MAESKNMTGLLFGRLTVQTRAGSIRERSAWLCRCICGSERIVTGLDLRRGTVKSCGCLRSETISGINIARSKHGHTRGRKPSPEWISWNAMKNRCYLSSMPNYVRYGGRGIKVCDEWLGEDGFANFLKTLGPRPVGTSLDRINTNGDYEPGNCRWATPREQSLNRRITPALRQAMLANLAKGRMKRSASPFSAAVS